MTRHHPFYCEENVWWLLGELGEAEAAAVFITNADRAVALWQQRAAPPDEPIVWDYHVIALSRGEVHDLDCRLGRPIALRRYLAETFRPCDPVFAPRFRVVGAPIFRDVFATDRSHMRRSDGSFAHPPPPWDPPGAPGMNLMRFVDLNDPIAGEVLDLAGLLKRAEAEAIG